MSDKLLHQRLRELNCTLSGTCVTAFGAVEDCTGITCRECTELTANRIADEIERYYIPRPRFEDGEPVQFGD